MERNRPIGFWLKLVDGLIDSQFESTLEEHGVTRRPWQVLNLLADNPSTVADLETELEPFLSLPAEETIPEHLEELTESGWITESGGQYSLAELGRNSLSVLGEVAEQNRKQISDGVSPEDYETTVAVLDGVWLGTWVGVRATEASCSTTELDQKMDQESLTSQECIV